MIPGSNATVTIEHLTVSRDAHGAKSDGAPDQSFPGLSAMIARASLGNLWKITVDGDFGDIGKGPTEWRVTDNTGRVFAPVKATYRAPITQLGETDHTLLFCELHGEIESDVRV